MAVNKTSLAVLDRCKGTIRYSVWTRCRVIGSAEYFGKFFEAELPFNTRDLCTPILQKSSTQIVIDRFRREHLLPMFGEGSGGCPLHHELADRRRYVLPPMDNLVFFPTIFSKLF